jgi:hypothetical protein
MHALAAAAFGVVLAARLACAPLGCQLLTKR